MSLTEEIISILACPKCRGDLALVSPAGNEENLVCKACRLAYPVQNGIPVLLLEEAKPYGGAGNDGFGNGGSGE